MARILGNEMTDSELVMVFDGFLKDLDEVNRYEIFEVCRPLTLSTFDSCRFE